MALKFSSKRVLLAFSWYNNELHRGVVEYAQNNGWFLELVGLPNNKYQVGEAPDGIIGNLGFNDRILDIVKRADCPLVDLANNHPDYPCSRVTCDNLMVGRIAAKHFLDRDFSNFLLLTHYNSFASVDRFSAFTETVKAHTPSADIQHLHFHSSETEHLKIEDKVNQLGDRIEKCPKPLALFAQEDYLGIYTIEACADRGIDVPGDVSILACDNDELICESIPIPLSSVDTNMKRQGYEAAARLNEIMNADETAHTVKRVPPAGIHVRQSSNIYAVDHPLVKKALSFISQNYRNSQLDVNAVVEATGASRSGLSEAFRSVLHRGVAEEIRRMRIETAKGYLRKNLSVRDTAALAGFSDERTFRKTFKNQTGQKPSAFAE